MKTRSTRFSVSFKLVPIACKSASKNISHLVLLIQKQTFRSYTLFDRNGLANYFLTKFGGQHLGRRVMAQILAKICAAMCWPKFW